MEVWTCIQPYVAVEREASAGAERTMLTVLDNYATHLAKQQARIGRGLKPAPRPEAGFGLIQGSEPRRVPACARVARGHPRPALAPRRKIAPNTLGSASGLAADLRQLGEYESDFVNGSFAGTDAQIVARLAPPMRATSSGPAKAPISGLWQPSPAVERSAPLRCRQGTRSAQVARASAAGGAAAAARCDLCWPILPESAR